jgi:transposase InsO family protein
MCRVLKVSRSGYYAWLGRPIATRDKENIMLEKRIEEIYLKNEKRYGSPRIYDALRKKGASCGRHRVARLMRKKGLAAHGKRKFKATTNSKHDQPVHPNLLARNFTASAPNQVWTGDITYIATAEGWLYLAVVIDLFSRRVIGWAFNNRIDTALVIQAVQMAITSRKPRPGLIFHSDRGSQYASHLFQEVLSGSGLRPSMSRKGDCWDNAPTESFFATLKKELIRNLIYFTRRLAMTEIFRYIEGYYNNARAHSTLGYDSPAQFERRKAA